MFKKKAVTWGVRSLCAEVGDPDIGGGCGSGLGLLVSTKVRPEWKGRWLSAAKRGPG